MKHRETLDKIKKLRADLDRIEKDIGGVRDQLENLLADAEDELATVEEAKTSLDELIDRLSEQH